MEVPAGHGGAVRSTYPPAQAKKRERSDESCDESPPTKRSRANPVNIDHGYDDFVYSSDSSDDEEEPSDEPRGLMFIQDAMDVNKSAAKIQAFVRRVNLRTKLVQVNRAATNIQSIFRGVLARAVATKANESATKIQSSTIRCFTPKKRERSDDSCDESPPTKRSQAEPVNTGDGYDDFVYSSDSSYDEEEPSDEPRGLMFILDAIEVHESAAAAKILQAFFRRVNLRTRLVQANRAATSIQSFFRGVLVRAIATKANESATKIQSTFRGFSTRSLKPRSQPRIEFDAAAKDVATDADDDGQESVNFDAGSFTTDMDADDDGQESVNFDTGSNTAEADTVEAIGAEQLEEEGVDNEEEEVEVVQPAPQKRRRMVAELQSTLDGRYWRQATTRRVIVRD